MVNQGIGEPVLLRAQALAGQVEQAERCFAAVDAHQNVALARLHGSGLLLPPTLVLPQCGPELVEAGGDEAFPAVCVLGPEDDDALGLPALLAGVLAGIGDDLGGLPANVLPLGLQRGFRSVSSGDQ